MPPSDALKAPPPRKKDEGAPAWVLTFADLMSLLLAFFVLLFSFSEIDKQKFKQLAGSMKQAFGVQREMRATDTPVGTNIIAREFSPSMSPASAINEIRQVSRRDPMTPEDLVKEKNLEKDLEKVKKRLAVEIEKGQIEVSADGQKAIIIRIKEKASFPSGSASLNPGFESVITKIGGVAEDITEGKIVVAGHTDDVPIYNARFRNNWDLSSARAATVLDEIVRASGQPKSRFHVTGHADTRPIDSNATAEGRARNRRVEVILLRGAPYMPPSGP